MRVCCFAFALYNVDLTGLEGFAFGVYCRNILNSVNGRGNYNRMQDLGCRNLRNKMEKKVKRFVVQSKCCRALLIFRA